MYFKFWKEKIAQVVTQLHQLEPTATFCNVTVAAINNINIQLLLPVDTALDFLGTAFGFVQDGLPYSFIQKATNLASSATLLFLVAAQSTLLEEQTNLQIVSLKDCVFIAKECRSKIRMV